MLRGLLNSLSRRCGKVRNLSALSTGCLECLAGLCGLYESFTSKVRSFSPAYSTGIQLVFTDSWSGFTTVSTGPTIIATNLNKFRSSGGRRNK